MNNTALGAVSNKKENIRFISEAHEKFYYEKLKEVRYVDVYHKALCYCLGISDDTRRNINRIYDFKTGCVKPECLHDGWQTSGSEKVVRMAFNLYCNGTPSVDDELDAEEQIDECRRYSAEDLDKSGDNFRYPTSYSLEYRFDDKKLDISNVYKYLKAIINFLDSCDSMLDELADYENEMCAEYESEMRASMDWY